MDPDREDELARMFAGAERPGVSSRLRRLVVAMVAGWAVAAVAIVAVVRWAT